MDYKRFEQIVRKQWSILDQDRGFTLFTVDECLDVFRCFFDTYKQFRGVPHPPLKAEQVRRIMIAMPFIVQNGAVEDVPACLYPYMIWRYFNTRYRADYRINHFFAGQVRAMKYHEAMRMED